MNANNLKKEIKKIKVWHVAVLCAAVFIAFAIIGSILLAASGGWLIKGGHIDFGKFPPIGPGKLYEVNDQSDLGMEGVARIRIITVSDDVTIQSGGDRIASELKGQCRSTTDPVKLDARQDGDAVIIEVKYPVSISSSNTALTVTIPEAYAGGLEVSAVSGDIRAEGLPFRLQSVGLDTVSGGIAFGAQSCTSLKARTTSGDVTLTGVAAPAAVNTISGDVGIDFTAPVATTISTVSGSVTAWLPENAALKIDFGTVSGSFRSNHQALGVSSADHGFSGTMNGGTELLKVDTTSGDFRIEGK